jgi:hypothetical protein
MGLIWDTFFTYRVVVAGVKCEDLGRRLVRAQPLYLLGCDTTGL